MALTQIGLSNLKVKNVTALTTVIYNRFLSTNTNRQEYDLVVVGGGIVGVATAREILQRNPKLKVGIVEKESKLAVHQSGHNSGVIHAGIYYKPGSLKAKLCVEGLHRMYDYCDQKKIPYKKCGKLIVATNQTEIERLDELYKRGLANNCPDLQILNGKEIQDVEPFCRGIKAIWSPQTGIVDYTLVTDHYGKDFKESGGDIHFDFKVNAFKAAEQSDHPVNVISKDGKVVKAKYVLTCGGLQSDLLAELSECHKYPRIVPFRGEYLLLNPDKCHMIRGNIYPVPDPRFPFLGVHFTPRMDGSVWLGPNAVLAFKREGYTWSDINFSEFFDTLKFPGFRKLALKNVTAGATEVLKSAYLPLQMKDLQKYIPEITVADIKRGPAGVRAQAMDVEGSLVDDFVFDLGKGTIGKRVLHCRNAPSPGATSSLSIARMMADKVEKEFTLLKKC